MSHPVPAAPRSSFRGLGRTLEQIVWQFRSYLIPSHIATYRRIVREHAIRADNAGRKFVCFDFTKVGIDIETGRYAFSLVRDFEALGCLVCYRKNFRFLATMRHKAHKRLLLNRPFHICESVDELPEGSVAAEVTDRSSLPEKPARRQIRVRYEPAWPQSDREVPMPFFVHPEIYDQLLSTPAPDLETARAWRVFFAGTAVGPRYGTDVLPVNFGKMSRVQILNALEAALPPDRLRRIQSAAELERDDAQHPSFVWVGAGDHRIPRAEWLKALSRADFFLACPGVEMPLCHNLIEALARGAVPILEHPEFLDPPLEHNVNCLVFCGREELLQTFEQVFRFSAEQILRLRQGAFAYWKNHLAPGRFAQRLLSLPHSRVDLLFNAYRVPRLPRCN